MNEQRMDGLLSSFHTNDTRLLALSKQGGGSQPGDEAPCLLLCCSENRALKVEPKIHIN